MAMHLLPENIVNLSAASTDAILFKTGGRPAVTLDVLRLDKIDPVISGNKWFKLKYYLEQALQHRQKCVLTFGGAWSNHILATACAANKAGLRSIGIIRGEQPDILSATLSKAASWGMQLVFISRNTYNLKKDPAFIEQLLQAHDYPCIIPAGGEGELGIQGAAEIADLLPDKNVYTHLICAVGTGTLLTGLVKNSLLQQQIIGIPVLKGFDHWLPSALSDIDRQRISVLPGYHQGGYAKKNAVLTDFMNQLYNDTGIPTDFVYTGKMFFSIYDLLKKNYFPIQSRLLAIHSGGLQGNDSLPPGTLGF